MKTQYSDLFSAQRFQFERLNQVSILDFNQGQCRTMHRVKVDKVNVDQQIDFTITPSLGCNRHVAIIFPSSSFIFPVSSHKISSAFACIRPYALVTFNLCHSTK